LKAGKNSQASLLSRFRVVRKPIQEAEEEYEESIKERVAEQPKKNGC